MRAFVAVEISKGEILKEIQTFQEKINIDAKPTRVDQIHFTLQFLGEIDKEQCEQVKDVLNKIDFSEFKICLKGVGGFPNLKNPRVVWVGMEKDGAEKLTVLANEIGTKLTILGFEKERKFKPHLTIFRIRKKIGNISAIMKDFEAEEFGTEIISKIKLKKSVLSPKGPEYSDLLEVNAN